MNSGKCRLNGSILPPEFNFHIWRGQQENLWSDAFTTIGKSLERFGTGRRRMYEIRDHVVFFTAHRHRRLSVSPKAFFFLCFFSLVQLLETSSLHPLAHRESHDLLLCSHMSSLRHYPELLLRGWHEKLWIVSVHVWKQLWWLKQIQGLSE